MSATTEPVSRRAMPPWLPAVATLVLLCAIFGYTIFQWTFSHVYVPQGQSLRLRYKGAPLPFLPGASAPTAAPGMFAKVNDSGLPMEKGVLVDLRGPGRHFYNMFWYDRELVPDVTIPPGSIGIVKSKMGRDLPAGEFIVEGELGATEYKGILRRVLGPGRYRVNDYAYEITPIQTEQITSGSQTKYAGWVNIPPGFVGVVTNLASNSALAAGGVKGILDDVLPPGLYMVNPREKQVDVVEIGFRELTIEANHLVDSRGLVVLDAAGEPAIANDNSGITFPSNDGFTITMDFTAIWAIMPDQAADVIRKFGNVDAVENKVVLPQVQSICRNMGSKLGAVDLLVGESRQVFQQETSEQFRHILQDKDITLLYGLVRNIHIPQEVRLPIQQAFVADELKLTREQETLTAATEALLSEAQQTVLLEAERVRVETEKMVAQALAEGQRQGQELRAETETKVAAIDRQVAVLESQTTVLRGEALAGSQKMMAEASADKFKLAVEAFGDPAAYNKWVFATGLPQDLELQLLYAGQGTFWTDLKGFTETMLAKDSQSAAPTPAPVASAARTTTPASAPPSARPAPPRTK